MAFHTGNDHRVEGERHSEDDECRVTYSYSVGGNQYQGTRIGFITRGTAQQLARTYPAGKVVDVFYDPANPASAVLQR